MRKSFTSLKYFYKLKSFRYATFSCKYFLVLLFAQFLTLTVYAQSIVSGVVKDTKGESLVGVSVKVKNSNSGTVTDIHGKYAIQVSGSPILIFSYIGFINKQVVVNSSVVNVTLSENVNALNEVVVVGFGTQKKETLTGSISTIKPSDLLKAPVSSIANALAGRTTGITTTQRSGEPGRDVANIYIRGVATFTGETNAAPLVLVDGVERSLSGLDPYTIETINILKDASATAVFGVKGANGVIIITTKTGTVGKPQIGFSSNFALQNPIRLPELLNAYDYARLRNEAEVNDVGPTAKKFSDSDLDHFRKGDDPYFHPDINWFDYMLKKYAPQQQYNFNVSGGTTDSKYFVSLGYLNQDGAYKIGDFFKQFSANPNYKRYNIRSNFDFNVSKNFSISIKASSELSSSNYSGSNTSDIIGTILAANPVMSPVIYDNKIIRNVKGLESFQISNTPLYQMLTQGYNSNFTSNLNTDLLAAYKLNSITKGLSVRARGSYDSYYLQSVKRTKQIPLYDLFRNPSAKTFADSIVPVAVINSYEGPTAFNSESFTKVRKVYAEAAIDYARSFGPHALTGLILGNLERAYKGGNELPYNFVGLVARATYNFKNKYLAEANMGYNGSENFAVGKQFGFFPSFSAGYVLSEESFFPKGKTVSFLKIRGSYGKVGNYKIDPYRFLFVPSSYVLVTPNSFNNNVFHTGINHTAQNGYTEGLLGNPDVSWEEATKFNVGADIKFFNDRLSFTGDYFQEDRNKILAQLNVPITFGSSGLLAPYNIGVTTNKGFEIELNFNDNINSFTYWINTNYSFARNKIIYEDEPPQPYPGLSVTGNSIGQPKGLIADGLYNTLAEINDPNRPKTAWEGAGLKPGDIRYVDVNKDGKIDDNDAVNIGHPNIPEIVYGATFGAQWKGVSVSILFQGAGNVSSYLQGEAAWPFTAGVKTAFANANESWSQERYDSGQKISLPRLTASPGSDKNNYRVSTFWQEDASYLRVKTVELAYQFNSSLIKRYGLKGLRFYVNGQNLYTWTKMKYFDPEIPNLSGGQSAINKSNGATNGAVYPMVRVFNLGTNIQF